MKNIDTSTNNYTIINGGAHQDDRGTLVYNNDVDYSAVKRFYMIKPAAETLRGWQGHKIEQKWFTAIRGSLLILIVRPDNWDKPSYDLKPTEIILKEGTGNVLHIPAGYATAIKAITPEATLGVFSDLGLQDSIEDSYRFDPSLWYYESFM